MNELGALLRDVRRPSGDPVEVVLLAVAVRYCIVPVVGDGTFGEVSRWYSIVSIRRDYKSRNGHALRENPCRQDF